MEEVCAQYSIRCHLTDSGEQVFHARDVCAALGISQAVIAWNRLPTSERVNLRAPTATRGMQEMTFLTLSGVRRMLTKNRSLQAPDIARGFGMDLAATHYSCDEQCTIGFLARAFEDFRMVHQFRCQQYYIDLYFPDQRVAVECDEESTHGAARAERDWTRQVVIEQTLKCKFVRYRPQRSGFNQADVVKEVLRAMGLVPEL